VNSKLRPASRTCDRFPNDDSAIEALCLVSSPAVKERRTPPREPAAVTAQFVLRFA